MKYVIIALVLLTSFGCNNAPKPLQETGNTAAANKPSEKPQTAIAHSLENQTPNGTAPSGEKSKWTQGGDAIDTKDSDTAIASAEIVLKKNPDDAAAKKAAAAAYFNRGEAVTKARQYASALGDYRRTIKYDPSNATAKNWIEQITMIYDSMNRQSPKEGEEPPPLPFEKEK